MRIAAAGAALLGGSLWLLWPVTGRVDSTGAAREPQAMALPASDPAPVSGAPETESSPAAPPSPIPRTAAPVSAVPGPGIGQPGRYPPPAEPPARPPPGELKLPEPRRSSDAFLSWLARRLGLGLLYLGFSGWLFRYLLEPRQ